MKFKKKPVIIEAFQMSKDMRYIPQEWPEWLHEQWGVTVFCDFDSDKPCFIQTLEGKLYVSYDDWIIKGVHGELYACKPDIFEETYESVE